MIPLRDANPTKGTPWVTILLIALNVLVFLIELFADASGQLNRFYIDWGVVPVELTADPIGEWPTLFSSMFVHGGWFHLLGNMLYLWIFGDNVEERLGHIRYLLFYLLGGLLATATQVAINPDSGVPNIGASGAIAAVLGGYLILYPRAQITTLVVRFVTRVPAVVVLGFWFVYQFFFGVASLSEMETQVGGTAFFAHIGGFVAGMLAIVPFQIGRPADDQGDSESRVTHYTDPWDF